MPDREEKHSNHINHHVDIKEQGLFAAFDALKPLNASAFSTEELANQITARTRTALKAQCIAIWLADSQRTKISLQAYSCSDYINILPKNYFYSLDKPSDIADCLQKNKASQQKKYALAENDPRMEAFTGNLAGALLPLQTPAGVIGVLEMITSSDDAINKDELESLELLASQVALLLLNQQDSEQKTHQNTLQNQLFEITAKINQAKDYESILQITVEELCSALNLPAASMHVNLAAIDAQPDVKKEFTA